VPRAGRAGMTGVCHAVTVNEPTPPEPGAAVPDPALVVLVGPAGSGKSAWAAARYRLPEVVSSDQLRAVVGSSEHDLDASADAFTLLDQIVAARVRRGLTTVIDTLGLDPARRRGYAELARRQGLASVAVVFDTDPAECRRRNRGRDHAVPAAVLDGQLRRMRNAVADIPAEGWDLVLRAGSADPAHPADPAHSAHLEPSHTPGARSAARAQQRRPVRLGFVLQLSRFGWDGYPGGPAGWLRSVARNAAEAGLQGIALMDHLIQIPQVGRAWEPIPEPWVTLGMLAGVQPDLRLGTLVTPVTFRAAGILAKTAATLDALSGGRAFCGIGAGWWAREHAAFGLPFPPAPDRLDGLEAAIETLRALWQPGTKAYQGERVSLPETTCYPRPASPIPVIVGGSGEQRTLRIAARLGDGCNLPSDPGELDRKLAVLREHCLRAGRDPAEVEITVLDVPVIAQDREHAATLVEQLRGRMTAAAFARRHHAGTPADHIGRYRLLAERGVTTVFVSLPDLAHPDDVLRLAPVAAAFA
jgi:alkanesulfonate monooxygenase SsuD/methylene tetrahydromethanopterin reductase-like flavin-dependent oxidoreductase (luciferase family)/predicted kinase